MWIPFAPVTDAGWNEALHAVLPVVNDPYHELLNYPLPANQPNVIIPFQVAKQSPVLLLSGPMIVNAIDTNPLTGLAFTVTNISTSLLGIVLNANLPVGANPPASNYSFQGLVTVVG